MKTVMAGRKVQTKAQDKADENPGNTPENGPPKPRFSPDDGQEEELRTSLQKRAETGQWVITNRDDMVIATERPGDHAPTPDKVVMWYYVDPIKKKITNEVARLEFDQDFSPLVSTVNDPSQDTYFGYQTLSADLDHPERFVLKNELDEMEVDIGMANFDPVAEKMGGLAEVPTALKDK